MKKVKKYQVVEVASPRNHYNPTGKTNVMRTYDDLESAEGAVISARLKAKEMAHMIHGMESWFYCIDEIEEEEPDDVDKIMKHLTVSNTVYSTGPIGIRHALEYELRRLLDRGIISVPDNS